MYPFSMGNAPPKVGETRGKDGKKTVHFSARLVDKGLINKTKGRENRQSITQYAQKGKTEFFLKEKDLQKTKTSSQGERGLSVVNLGEDFLRIMESSHGYSAYWVRRVRSNKGKRKEEALIKKTKKNEEEKGNGMPQR